MVLTYKPDSLTIPDDVEAELNDPAYAGKMHFCASTYRDGCRGPLCRMMNRDRGRQNVMRKAKARGDTYTPCLKLREYLEPINRDEVLYRIAMLQRDQILAERKAVSQANLKAYQTAYRQKLRDEKAQGLAKFEEFSLASTG